MRWGSGQSGGAWADDGRTMLTVRQRQQAVRVWAMRVWGAVEAVVVVVVVVVVEVAAASSGGWGCGVPSALVCVAVATSMATVSLDIQARRGAGRGEARNGRLYEGCSAGRVGREACTAMPGGVVAAARGTRGEGRGEGGQGCLWLKSRRGRRGWQKQGLAAGHGG